jgi:hypothetical protein
MMRNAIPFACAALLAAGLISDAAAIVRCEGADRKVTYSNTECPPNTRQVRKVDESPPVIVHDGKAAAASDAEPRPPARIEKAKSRAAAADPLQQDRQLTAQIAAQQRDCETRARRLQHLQEDLAAALPANRSSAELALRRAQDEYQVLCPKKQ